MSRVRTFDSTSPTTGEVVGSFPLEGPERVAGWAALGFEGRRRALLAYKAWTPWPPAMRWCSSRAS